MEVTSTWVRSIPASARMRRAAASAVGPSGTSTGGGGPGQGTGDGDGDGRRSGGDGGMVPTYVVVVAGPDETAPAGTVVSGTTPLVSAHTLELTSACGSPLTYQLAPASTVTSRPRPSEPSTSSWPSRSTTDPSTPKARASFVTAPRSGADEDTDQARCEPARSATSGPRS